MNCAFAKFRSVETDISLMYCGITIKICGFRKYNYISKRKKNIRIYLRKKNIVLIWKIPAKSKIQQQYQKSDIFGSQIY